MSKNKVVIIEDEIDLLELIAEMCVDVGFECYQFRTFEDFIFKYPQINPDLIITDLNLPGLSGNEVIKTIRSNDSKVPIIMISGSQSSYDNIEALNLGANDFITKPFNFDVFLAKIRNFLNLTNLSYINDIKFIPNQKLIKKDGLEIHLTDIESKIFEILFKFDQNFATREELHNSNKSRSLDVHINNLRKKITLINLEIDTVRNKGYRLKKVS